MSTRAIISRLTDAGIIKHPRLLEWYLSITGREGQLRSGDYTFPSPISAFQVIDKMKRGEVHYEHVTIPEGYNRFDIAETLAIKTGKTTKEGFLRLMDDNTLVKDIVPEAKNLEGYLFPDTYNYNVSTTPQELVKSMVRRFFEVFSDEWLERARSRGLTVHQVVTLASIIEKEARVPEDRPLISSVFNNRLKIGMPLGADPTFIYAAIIAGDYDGNPNQPRHRRRLSKYNTYIYAGLPPGPIASPGKASLEAALYPADTNYLYFVVGGADGHHTFSRSAAEHDAAVARYRKLQQQMR